LSPLSGDSLILVVDGFLTTSEDSSGTPTILEFQSADNGFIVENSYIEGDFSFSRTKFAPFGGTETNGWVGSVDATASFENCIFDWSDVSGSPEILIPTNSNIVCAVNFCTFHGGAASLAQRGIHITGGPSNVTVNVANSIFQYFKGTSIADDSVSATIICEDVHWYNPSGFDYGGSVDVSATEPQANSETVMDNDDPGVGPPDFEITNLSSKARGDGADPNSGADSSLVAPVSSVTVDYDGDVRLDGNPDRGAQEVPVSAPPAAAVEGWKSLR
jgi:hypothetical protein